MLYHLDITLLLSYNVPVCNSKFRGSQGNRGDADIDKQHIHVILYDNIRNIEKAMDDMEVPSVGCISHTLQLALHEGLLSQCSVTDSPANTRKVVGQCCSIIYRIRKSHMKVFPLFQQNNKTY